MARAFRPGRGSSGRGSSSSRGGGSSRPAYSNQQELMNTNWKQLQNEAEARGDYEAAARYESARNDKIASQQYKDWGGRQTQTHTYNPPAADPVWSTIDTRPPSYSGGGSSWSGGSSSGSASIGTPPLPSSNYGQNYNPSFSNPTPTPKPKPKLTMNEYLNKSGGDYSLAYRYADEDGADPMVLSQIQAGRAAKVQTMYGGKDPYKGSYDIWKAPGDLSMGTSAATDSIWKKGGMSFSGPNVARDPVRNNIMKGGAGFENGRVAMGEWTHIYDEKGRWTGRVKDGGASANRIIPMDPALINKSEAHRKAYEAAVRGDSDAVGHWLGEISKQGGVDQYGNYDMTEANNYNQRLQQAFGPGFKNFLRNKYNGVYGQGAWEDPNFYGRGQVDPNYAAMAQQAQANAANGSFPGVGGSIVGGGTMGGVPTPDMGAYGGGGRPGGGFGGSFEGSFGGGGFDFNPGSGADYIRQMYAQQQAEAEAKLKAAYEAQLSKLRGQDDLIDTEYADRANQAAAQNELQRMQMAEMGIAQGLNTGATGQLALGQSMALQGALGGLDQAAAQDRMANQRAIDELNAMYEQKMAEIAAGIQADMTNALLDDYNRQQALYLEQQRQAQEDAWRQQQWEYQVGQDALDRQYKDAQLAQAQREFEAKQALNEAKFYGNPTNAVSGGSSGGGSNTKSTYKSTVNNMGLTNEQIRQLQGLKPGLTVDGLWGPASSAAFGDMNAQDAWDAYGGSIKPAADPGFDQFMRVVGANIAQGNTKLAQNMIQQNWGSMTPEQQKRVTDFRASFN